MKKKILSLLICFTTLVSASSAFASDTYTVKKGDSLWKISKKVNIPLSTLIKYNPQIKDVSSIYVGDIIYISKNENNETNNASLSAYENEVVRLVNEIRATNGLNKLKISEELSNVARIKSQDMKDNNYFAHESPTYGSPFDMMRKFGISYRAAAENIAKGQNTPQRVVDAWMNSSGHRKNILNSSYTHIGVGHVKNGNFWTQMFIKEK